MASRYEQANETEAVLSSDLLRSCVHCGFCLEVCPTYQLSGDENNSPRGRLRLWREEAEGQLEKDPWTVTYTDECVGCLACQTACPANVPYGQIFETVRREHVEEGRSQRTMRVRLAAQLSRRPRLFDAVATPIRLARRWGWGKKSRLFPGHPSTLLSTAEYAKRLVERHQPKGDKVGLLVGCLMESVFREINFATVRVLVENGFRVEVPAGQSCCGALHQHAGLRGSSDLAEQQRAVFDSSGFDVVVTNSSGCGLALQHTLTTPVQDVLALLATSSIKSRDARSPDARVYLDLPCHLIHGQQVPGIAESVLDATGYRWELAPRAEDCCGSGGAYQVEQPERAREILARKAAFLEDAEGEPKILATSNHVCMMQWNSARSWVKQPFQVAHVVQLLDPGAEY